MEREGDWRLSRGQEEYLHGAICRLRTYPVDTSDVGRYAHCELCWATISPCGSNEHEAYQTVDGMFWICKSCFSDLSYVLCLQEEGKDEK